MQNNNELELELEEDEVPNELNNIYPCSSKTKCKGFTKLMIAAGIEKDLKTLPSEFMDTQLE